MLPAGPDEDPEPEVFLLTVDMLRADRLGAYGHAAARTPNVDALAARGTLFRHATTPLPRTTPGLASLLTGLWPQSHGSREVGQEIHPVPLLAEVLKRRGYATVGVSANGAAGHRQGLDRGFDAFVDGIPNLGMGGRADRVTDRLLALLDDLEVGAETPLFLWAHYLDPHFPYRPPRSFAPQPEAAACRELAEVPRGERGGLFNNLGGRAERALADCRALYDAEVAYVDAEIGRLLEALRERGRPAEEALVVFTADHGENLGEWGLYYEHGADVHEASLRVPLVFAGPGIAQRVDEEVARLEDVTPTLLELLAVPADERPPMDGADLSARLRRRSGSGGDELLTFAESGSALHPRSFAYLSSGRARSLACTNGPRFSLCGRPHGPLGLYDHTTDPGLTADLGDRFPEERTKLLAVRERWPPEQARQRAVRTARFKLVERPRPRGGYQRILYDLAHDPAEARDVAHRYPEVAARLGRELDRWTEELAAAEEAPALSEEAIETLRTLGYVE